MSAARTAMLLTEQEWQDLAAMVSHAKRCCYGSLGLCECIEHHDEPAQRMRTLADRILEATDNGHAETPPKSDENGRNDTP